MNYGVQVLETDDTNVKALYRRAQAHTHLVDLDLAELDIKKALEIDPENRLTLVPLNFVKVIVVNSGLQVYLKLRV
jgi:hypothetical protein